MSEDRVNVFHHRNLKYSCLKIYMSGRPTVDLKCNVSIISAIVCVQFIVGHFMMV